MLSAFALNAGDGTVSPSKPAHKAGQKLVLGVKRCDLKSKPCSGPSSRCSGQVALALVLKGDPSALTGMVTSVRVTGRFTLRGRH